LFAENENGELILAEGVNEEAAINAAKALVEALDDSVEEKAGLLEDIAKAEGFLGGGV